MAQWIQNTPFLRNNIGYVLFCLPAREEIIGAVLAGRDVLARQWNGGGKSLCLSTSRPCLWGKLTVVSLSAHCVDERSGRQPPGEGSRRRRLTVTNRLWRAEDHRAGDPRRPHPDPLCLHRNGAVQPFFSLSLPLSGSPGWLHHRQALRIHVGAQLRPGIPVAPGARGNCSLPSPSSP